MGKLHYKMYKAGKQWVVATLMATSLLAPMAGTVTNVAQAKTTHAQANARVKKAHDAIAASKAHAKQKAAAQVASKAHQASRQATQSISASKLASKAAQASTAARIARAKSAKAASKAHASAYASVKAQSSVNASNWQAAHSHAAQVAAQKATASAQSVSDAQYRSQVAAQSQAHATAKTQASQATNSLTASSVDTATSYARSYAHSVFVSDAQAHLALTSSQAQAVVAKANQLASSYVQASSGSQTPDATSENGSSVAPSLHYNATDNGFIKYEHGSLVDNHAQSSASSSASASATSTATNSFNQRHFGHAIQLVDHLDKAKRAHARHLLRQMERAYQKYDTAKHQAKGHATKHQRQRVVKTRQAYQKALKTFTKFCEKVFAK